MEKSGAVAADMVFQATDIIRRLPSTPATAMHTLPPAA
jgi:hypothetical protein